MSRPGVLESASLSHTHNLGGILIVQLHSDSIVQIRSLGGIPSHNLRGRTDFSFSHCQRSRSEVPLHRRIRNFHGHRPGGSAAKLVAAVAKRVLAANMWTGALCACAFSQVYPQRVLVWTGNDGDVQSFRAPGLPQLDQQ